jgi:hypothetical protein
MREIFKLQPRASTKWDHFVDEVDTLQKLHTFNLAPEIYEHGTCDIEVKNRVVSDKWETIRVGYILTNYFECTLSQLEEIYIQILLTIQDLRMFKNMFEWMREIFRQCEQAIHEQAKRAVNECNILNVDLHNRNILVNYKKNEVLIGDWGLATELSSTVEITEAHAQLDGNYGLFTKQGRGVEEYVCYENEFINHLKRYEKQTTDEIQKYLKKVKV